MQSCGTGPLQRTIFGKLPCQDFVSVLYSELTVLGQFKANVLMHFWRPGVQMRSLFSEW